MSMIFATSALAYASFTKIELGAPFTAVCTLDRLSYPSFSLQVLLVED